MLRYFPPTFPDESMFNIFAKYNRQFKGNNAYATIEELLGKMHLSINPLFIGNLEYLCEQMPDECDYTSDYFINNHTALPFYKPFIPAERYNKVVNGLKYGKLNSVMSALGITSGSFLNVKGIKYCPECIKSDKAKYGEAYIHITHQLHGVFSCPKHRCILNIANGSIDNREILFDIKKYEGFDKDSPMLPTLNSEMINLGEDVDALMRHYERLGDLERVTRKYNCRMHERGYISPTGLINQVKIHKEFSMFYSEEFLRQMKSQVEGAYESSWLRGITRKKEKVVNPIRHLLFIRFLFGSLSDFLVYQNEEYLPFGKPPYPCLNSNCEHYNKLMINDCTIMTNHNTSKAIGEFKCPVCMKRYKIKEEMYIRNGFTNDITIWNDSNGKKETVQALEDSSVKIQMEEDYKNRLAEHVKLNPCVSRRELSKKYNKEYRWIYKHHNEWLNELFAYKEKTKTVYVNQRVDWNKRDLETCEAVKSAIESLLSEEPPIRITIQQIANKCGYGALPRDIDKMPLSKALVSNNIESVEGFHKRKIEFVIQRLIKEDNKLVRHVILRMAGIPDKYYHAYDEFIKNKIE